MSVTSFQRIMNACETGDFFNTFRFFGMKDQIQKDFQSISADELKNLLETYFVNLSSQAPYFELSSRVELLAEVIPFEKLQEIIKSKYPNFLNAIDTAKAMFSEAKYYLEKTDSNVSPTLSARLASILDGIIACIESILEAFGIADFFQPAENTYHSNFKSHMLMGLVTVFTTLTSLLGTSLGATGGMIIGASLLLIGSLSLLFPYIRPMPSHLMRADNWTKQIQQKQVTITSGREKTLNAIAETLTANKKVKTHPLLIGKTGVGKTQTALAFAQAQERGDYPQLAGKKVFYINTANLLSSNDISGNGDILSKISKAMGRHRENIILVLDEIHLACQQREYSVIADQLKTLLDNRAENFPYVIGITTDEDYFRDIHLNQSAFARRFKKIHIEDTHEHETHEILNSYLLQEAPMTLLAEGALQHLFDATSAHLNDVAQPAASIQILSQCLNRLDQTQKTDTEQQIEEKSNRLQSIHSKHAVSRGGLTLPHAVDQTELIRLKQELIALENELKAEQAIRNQFTHLQEKLFQNKQEAYRTAVKVTSLAQDTLTSQEKKAINEFLLRSHFLVPILEKSTGDRAKKLKAKAVLDTSLIDATIYEEVQRKKATEEVIRKGKKQIKKRLGPASITA